MTVRRSRPAFAGLLLLVMSLESPVAAQPPPAASDWMNHLRRHEVRKVFLAEMHELPKNREVATDAVDGAAFGGRVQFWREIFFSDPYYEEYVKKMTKTGEKTEQLTKIFAYTDWSAGIPPTDISAIESALSNSNVTLKGIFFHRDKRRDLPNFIKSKRFAIANVGFMHILDDLTAASRQQSWSGYTRPIPSAYANLSFAARQAMYGGLLQARMANVKAVALLPSYVFETEMSQIYPRMETYRGANARGFVVLELPLDRPYNMTVFADQSLIPVLASFTGWTRRPQWFCGPIEGCPANYVHDEL